MAISKTNLTSGSDSTDKTAGQTYTTASITPSANKLILCAWMLADDGATPTVGCTLSGNGLTWDLITSANTATTEFRGSVYLFRAMGASPSTGAIAATVDGTCQSAGWSVFELDGVDTSGTNGSGAIVQSAKGESVSNGTTATATLASGAGDAANRCVAAIGLSADLAVTERTNWSEIHDVSIAVPNKRLETQWRSDAFEQTASGTWGSNARWAIVAAEIKAAAAAAPTAKKLAALGVG